MAVPVYDNDLVEISLCESVTGFSQIGTGNIKLGVGTDFAIQGTYAVDAQISAGTRGMMYDNGAGITNAAGVHFFQWIQIATPGLADTIAAGGKRFVLGTGTSDYMSFYVDGSDTNPGGGNKCYPVRYTTLETATRVKTGTPGTAPQYIGGVAAITGQSKGSNFGLDAMRYGTGVYVTAGDSGTPATFAGLAATNDAISNKWGVLSLVSGIYQLQGRLVIGQNASKTPTTAYFEDSNAVITFTDTPHSESDFTQIIVDHTGTVVDWTNITIFALGTNNPGRVVVNTTSTVNITNGVWTDIGVTVLGSGVNANGLAWVNCDQITQNGATLTGCTVNGTQAVSAIVADDPGLVSWCDFISSTNHAIEITVPGTYSFDGNAFYGFATQDGSTGNEVIYNNSGGAVTLNYSNTIGALSIRNGVGATTTISNPRTLKVTVKDSAGSPIVGALAYIDDNNLSPFIMNTITDASGIASVSYDGPTIPGSTWRVRKYGYKNYRQDIDISATDMDIPVALVVDPQQT